jgi:tetratricopeptide (TPR) repeat protein
VHYVKENNPQTSIFWVFAGTKERFEHDFIEIAKGLRLPGYNSADTDTLKFVKTYLEKPESGDWIMVIDNADDLSMFQGPPDLGEVEISQGRKCSTGLFNYIPRSPSGSVLYTTRNKADALKLTSEGRIIQVTEMDMDDLMSLLQTKLYDDTPDVEQFADLINTLGRLPLALVQAASYIRQNSWSVSKYLKYFRSKDSDIAFQLLLHDFRDQTRDYTVQNSLFMTWMITIEKIEVQHSAAAEALFIMAFYNRQNIPRCLLTDGNPSSALSIGSEYTSNIAYNSLDRISGDDAKFVLDQAIGTLVAYSLVSIANDTEPESYSIHRLVQTFTLYWLVKHRKTADRWADKALKCLIREFPAKEYDDWNKSAELLPHALSFIDLRPSPSLSPSCLGNLLITSSNYLRIRAQYTFATKYINLAIEILEKGPGGSEMAILYAKRSLARIYRATGRFQEAESLLCVAVGNYRNAFSAVNAETLSTVALLSQVLREQQKYTESETLARQCLQAYDEQSSDKDPELVDAKNAVAGALATVLGSIGQYKESLEIQQATLNYLLTSHPREHPRVMHCLHDIAVTLNLDGQYVASRELCTEVLSFNQKFYPPEHPRTSNIEYNLALVLERGGDHEAAEKHFQNVIHSYQETFVGENDPERGDCIRSLAQCLENQQKYQEANRYYELMLQHVVAKERSVGESTSTIYLKDDITKCLGRLRVKINEAAKESKEEGSAAERSIPPGVSHGSGGGGGGGSWSSGGWSGGRQGYPRACAPSGNNGTCFL